MNVTITQLSSVDLNLVDELMKRYSRTLGFLPREALQSYLSKGSVLGAKTNDGHLVGYLLYADRINYFRITHLCVMEDHRGRGIARQLINELKRSASTQKSIRLNCRRDFPANDMWPNLDFVALGEKLSRSKAGNILTIWQLTLAQNDQLELFQGKTSTDALDIIIDAQIFFDFDEPDTDKSMPAKALLADYLVDSLDLWITDELLNEIHRQDDDLKRKRSQNRAQNFPKIEYDPNLVEEYQIRLSNFLPRKKHSQESDIRQLAKAAASNVKTFVTRDGDLLKASKKICDTTNIEVVNPAQLIIQLHELTEGQSYAPNRIAGLNLRWERLMSKDLMNFPFASFQKYRERKGKLREKLESLIVQTNESECELLRSDDDIIAIRILMSNSSKILNVPLARIATSVKGSLFGRFLIADTVSKAVEKNIEMVKFNTSSLTPSLIPDLIEMGFIEQDKSFVRFCFSSYLNRTEALTAISELNPEFEGTFQAMSDIEFERRCSPLVLGNVDQNYFLIPIQPHYAMDLIDREQSSNSLFGGNPHILLRWDNVYYRSKNRHKMLVAPARILWYVSKKKEIIATSFLDDVVVDSAKELFRKFKKFGILEWRDIFKMCKNDPTRELMALKFSHTFPFRKPISLQDLKKVYKENNVGLSLRSPSKVLPEIFQVLFQKGYTTRYEN